MALAHERNGKASVGVRALKRWLPISLIAVGVIVLVFGFALSSVAILIPQKAPPPAPVSATPPPTPLPPTTGEMFPMPPPPPAPPPPPPPVSAIVPEAAVVQDVTVGGMTRLPDGKITRTYAPGEEKPSLCPT